MRRVVLTFALFLLALPASAQFTVEYGPALSAIPSCPVTTALGICYDQTTGCLTFEGATADAYELTLCVTDQAIDTTFTLGRSPDGNPWIGATAGDSAGSTETDNVLIGSAAGTAITGTATDNTAIGDNAGNALTSGDQNTLVGAESDGVAGLSNVTGLGYGATGLASTGTAVGSGAIAADGVTVGYGSGAAIDTSADEDNVILGTSAGVLVGTGGASTDNTIIGDSAGGVLTLGDRSVYLGANATASSSTDSDNTVIGEGMFSKNSDTIIIGFGGAEHYFYQGTAKTLVESTPTALFRIACAFSASRGLVVEWTVFANDGTEFQALTGISQVQMINKAGAETCVVATAGGVDEAASSGTLAYEDAPACASNAANTLDFTLDIVSSLAQTSLVANYVVRVLGASSVVITPQ